MFQKFIAIVILWIIFQAFKLKIKHYQSMKERLFKILIRKKMVVKIKKK